MEHVMVRFLPFLAVISWTGLCITHPPAKNWQKLYQQPYEKLPIPKLGLRPILQTADGTPINTAKGWQQQRKTIASKWQQRLGKAPTVPNRLDVQTHKTEKQDGYTRKLVSFRAANGDRINAYLLIPDGIRPGEKRPAVVVFHQTTKFTLREPVGLGPNASLALAEHLVKRGYVVLAPECYIMKAKGPRDQAKVIAEMWPDWTGMGKMVFDASRCVDFLQSLSFVDASRIGCIGHSLGAKQVLYAMAFEPRFAVGVFNEGGIGLRMSNWTDPWYLTARMKAHIPNMEHHQVLALVAPRPILILGGDSADGDDSWPFLHAALPVYRLLKAEEKIGLMNHHGKHSFPQPARRAAYEWIDHWLEFTPVKDEVGPE